MPVARLPRTVFRLHGDNLIDWLNGLITNSIDNPVTFAALLTPQGKIIADFFIHKEHDALLLETPTKFAEGLHKRLRMYRLRAACLTANMILTRSKSSRLMPIWSC